ncbi:MAG TPA: GNAT family N-acetyltransferase [Mycobacteriales bacterium]|jgi:GNAT superfamily N-acetyltransferase
MLADRAAAGLHAHWRAQCGYVTGGEVAEHDGVLLTLTHAGDPTLNCAFVPGTPADPAGAVDWVVAAFERRGLTPGIELRAGRHPEIEDLLRRRGFRVVVSRPAMVRHPLAGPSAGGGGGVAGDVAVRRVASDGDLAAFQAVQAEVFGMAPDVAARFLPRAGAETPGIAWFVASYGGVDCGTSGATMSEHGVGVVGVGTLKAYRHRGVGRAVTAAAVAWGAEQGADLAWLYPSDMARRMYERLGFATLDDVARVWVGPA